jgi:hypothetical protein
LLCTFHYTVKSVGLFFLYPVSSYAENTTFSLPREMKNKSRGWFNPSPIALTKAALRVQQSKKAFCLLHIREGFKAPPS